MENNRESMTNTRASGDEAGSVLTNSQPRVRPATRSTATSRVANANSLPSQPNAYTPNQAQAFSVDLTNLDDVFDNQSSTGMTATSPYFNNDIGTPVPGGMGSMAQQNFFNTVDPVLKFDSDAPGTVKREGTYDYTNPNAFQPFNMAQVTKFESQAPESTNANTGLGAFGAQPFARMSTAAPPPPPHATPVPASQYSRGDTVEAIQEQAEHVPPNRITEAGPIPHPDRDWRPYGTNHWHVFLESPDTLKYLSTAEIKEIREHCNHLNKTTLEGAGNPDNDNNDEDEDDDEERILPIPNTAYTTADAQTVWAHCDAYIRRRGQLRNNNAARRSRQRRDAELRYWKQKAVEHGCPDHEFVWDGKELPPDPSANAYASVIPPNTTTTTASSSSAAALPPPAPPPPILQAQTRGAARRSVRVQGHRRAAATAAAARAGAIAASEAAAASGRPRNQGSGTEPDPFFDSF